MNKKTKETRWLSGIYKSWLSCTMPVSQISGSTVLLVAVILAVLMATGGPASAAPPQSSVSGLVYPSDGLNTSVAAQQVGSALTAIGYANTTYPSGRTAKQAWDDGANDAVFGVFGHANAGVISTDEGPVSEYQLLYASCPYGPYCYSLYQEKFWSDYLPFIYVDDMRLAILAGCDTANVHPVYGSFGQVGKERGIDSIIGFTDLIYSPANCGENCLYSGNYFWSRFAAYVRNGDTVVNALSKAGNDLYAREGSYQGYDKYKIEGALANPGDVRLVPAAYGEPYNSQPLGGSSSSSTSNLPSRPADILLAPSFFGELLNSQLVGPTDTFNLNGLTTSSEHPLTIDNRQVWDRETTQGISYRIDANTKELLWLMAPASTTGQTKLTEDEAWRAASDFADRYVPWFEEADGVVTASRPNHLDGDELFGYSWRIGTVSGPGPRLVEIEVDRRTGAIVHYAQAVASPSVMALAISREDAISNAQEAVGTVTTVESAVSEVWNQPVWLVTLNRAGENLTPDLLYIVIDGQTGEVVHQEAT